MESGCQPGPFRVKPAAVSTSAAVADALLIHLGFMPRRTRPIFRRLHQAAHFHQANFRLIAVSMTEDRVAARRHGTSFQEVYDLLELIVR